MQTIYQKGITMKKAPKKEAPGTHAWLTATTRNGRRRIETLGWKRLASLYYASAPGSPIRKTINAEARRCGYTPGTILAMHAE